MPPHPPGQTSSLAPIRLRSPPWLLRPRRRRRQPGSAAKLPADHCRLARGDRGLLRRGGSRDLWGRLAGAGARSAGPDDHRASQYLERGGAGQSVGQGESPDATAGGGPAGRRVGHPGAGYQPGRGGGSRFEPDRLGSRSRPRHGRTRPAGQRRCRRSQRWLRGRLRAAEPAQAGRQGPHRHHRGSVHLRRPSREGSDDGVRAVVRTDTGAAPTVRSRRSTGTRPTTA